MAKSGAKLPEETNSDGIRSGVNGSKLMRSGCVDGVVGSTVSTSMSWSSFGGDGLGLCDTGGISGGS